MAGSYPNVIQKGSKHNKGLFGKGLKKFVFSTLPNGSILY